MLIEFRAHLNGGTTLELPYPRDFLSRFSSWPLCSPETKERL